MFSKGDMVEQKRVTDAVQKLNKDDLDAEVIYYDELRNRKRNTVSHVLQKHAWTPGRRKMSKIALAVLQTPSDPRIPALINRPPQPPPPPAPPPPAPPPSYKFILIEPNNDLQTFLNMFSNEVDPNTVVDVVKKLKKEDLGATVTYYDALKRQRTTPVLKVLTEHDDTPAKTKIRNVALAMLQLS